MRPRRIHPLVFLLPLLCPTCFALAAEDKGSASSKQAHADMMNKVLPEVSFQDVPFDDVVDFLRDATGFQAVIVRDPGVTEGQPVIRLRLKSVPLGQLLQVLTTAYPEISLQTVENANAAAPVHVIRINPLAEPATAENQSVRLVRVYPLAAEILSVLRARGEPLGQSGADKDQIKKGLDQVLSLIKGVVEASGEKAPPTLAVHEETQSLIVTGTLEQQGRVEETLASLRGERVHVQQNENAALAAASQQWRTRKADYEEQIDKLHHDVERLRQELDVARAEAREAQEVARKEAIDAERARVRLEEALVRSKSASSGDGGGGSTPGAK